MEPPGLSMAISAAAGFRIPDLFDQLQRRRVAGDEAGNRQARDMRLAEPGGAVPAQSQRDHDQRRGDERRDPPKPNLAAQAATVDEIIGGGRGHATSCKGLSSRRFSSAPEAPEASLVAAPCARKGADHRAAAETALSWKIRPISSRVVVSIFRKKSERNRAGELSRAMTRET